MSRRFKLSVRPESEDVSKSTATFRATQYLHIYRLFELSQVAGGNLFNSDPLSNGEKSVGEVVGLAAWQKSFSRGCRAAPSVQKIILKKESYDQFDSDMKQL